MDPHHCYKYFSVVFVALQSLKLNVKAVSLKQNKLYYLDYIQNRLMTVLNTPMYILAMDFTIGNRDAGSMKSYHQVFSYWVKHQCIPEFCPSFVFFSHYF